MGNGLGVELKTHLDRECLKLQRDELRFLSAWEDYVPRSVLRGVCMERDVGVMRELTLAWASAC